MDAKWMKNMDMQLGNYRHEVIFVDVRWQSCLLMWNAP
jgi:hypothetical protein